VTRQCVALSQRGMRRAACNPEAAKQYELDTLRGDVEIDCRRSRPIEFRASVCAAAFVMVRAGIDIPANELSQRRASKRHLCDQHRPLAKAYGVARTQYSPRHG
jgi:hypothetical protein